MPKKWKVGIERRPKTFCYLRVSCSSQETEKNKADALKFANDKDLGRIEWVEEVISGRHPWRDRKVGEMIEGMEGNDILILPEISRLGRSMLECMEMLSILKNKGCKVYSIKDHWTLDDTITSKIVGMVFSMAAEIERSLIRARSIEGINARRAKGLPLGRPRGLGKSRFDPYKDEIIALLRNGSPKTFVAKKYGMDVASLHHWLKRHQIDAKARIEEAPEMKRRV
jgi:DNA invertase Pin-like site-specific DNA recombinase